jgi:hypothetical protein
MWHLMRSPAGKLIVALVVTISAVLNWSALLYTLNARQVVHVEAEMEALRLGFNDAAAVERISKEAADTYLPIRRARIAVCVVMTVCAVFAWWMAWYVAEKS